MNSENSQQRPNPVSWFAIPALCLSFATVAVAQDASDDEDANEAVEEIVVYGVSTGAEAGIRAQRNSRTLVNVVSEESLDSLPDQSIGEALSRLPGVGVLKDRGEAERVFIRGADARLNAVTVNGDRLPSPESTVAGFDRGQRSVRMNSIPATILSEIKVWKAVPPDRDADSVGGAVEFVTKSATELDAPLLEATIRYGQNDLPDDSVSSFEVTGGTRLNAAGTWGVIATYSWEENNRAVEGLTATWDDIDEVLDPVTGDDVDLGGDFFVYDDQDIIWRDLERTRQGLNVTFDYKPWDDAVIKFGGFWSEFEDRELRRRLQLRMGSSSDYLSDTVFNAQGVAVSGSVDGGRVRKRIRPGVKTQQTWNAFIEGDMNFFDEWNFGWRLSNTFADRELVRTRTRFEARAQDIGLRGDGIADFTFANGTDDVVLFTQPAWANDPDVLEVGNRGDYLQRRGDISEDEISALKLDLARSFDLAGGSEFELAFGYKGRFNERSLWNRLFEFDGNEDQTIFMSEVLGGDRVTPEQPFGLQNGIWGDQSLMDELFRTQPDRFEFDGDNADENYFVDEDIHAAYVMGTWISGPWTTTFGVRFEDTETEIRAIDGTAKNSYSDLFPALILKYDLSDNIVLRGAYTQSIGRPDFTDLRPFFDEDFDFDPMENGAEIFIDGGNPLLEPFEAQSFDLSAEYYFNNGGVISLGMFYKEIENFEYFEELEESDIAISSLPTFLQNVVNDILDDARETDPTIPADLDTLGRFRFQRPVNGDDADLLGFELNYQQKFDMLPSPWSNFGFFANYTTVDGDSDITDGVSRDFIIGQFEDVMNLQLFYELENFSARLAYNRNGVTYELLGLGIDDGAIEDAPADDRGRDVEETIDLALQYSINDQFRLFLDVNNLTDEDSLRRFLGSSGTVERFDELEYGGRTVVLGLKWELL